MDMVVSNEEEREALIDDIKNRKLPFRSKVDSIYPQAYPSQGRYYWGVIVKIISEYLGMFPMDVHNMLLGMFARVGDATDENGKEFMITESTSGMDMARRERFYSDIKTWFVTKYGEYIPDTGEYIEDDEIVLKFIDK